MSDKLFSEEWGVIGVIDPDASAAGSLLTSAIDMSKYEQIAAVLLLGDRVAGAAVDFALQSSATSGGSYAAITGKSITQVVDTSPIANASNKQYIINLRSSEVTSNNRYVKAAVTIGSPSVGTDLAVVVMGKARHMPATDDDLSSVSQIVN